MRYNYDWLENVTANIRFLVEANRDAYTNAFYNKVKDRPEDITVEDISMVMGEEGLTMERLGEKW